MWQDLPHLFRIEILGSFENSHGFLRKKGELRQFSLTPNHNNWYAVWDSNPQSPDSESGAFST